MLESAKGLASLHFDGRNASVNPPWFEVAGSYRSEAKHRAFSDLHARPDRRSGADPRVRTDFHGIGEKRKCRVVVIVCGSAEIGTLRQDRMGSDCDGRWVVDFRAVGRSDLIFASQVPWCPDFGPGIKVAMWP